ncbi:hypothetical protein ACIRP2_05650 [Streptomyces sp. NPDC101194]|uniref:hypothetical protein n=1 Tax=Streptomyces sp. NPDC101194 TaxID=3366127 RepID=UPI003822014A
MTSVPYARATTARVRCWLCGTTKTPLRSDVHVNGHLCPPCWAVQPRGYNAWVRAASALALRLGLGRHWTDNGLRQGWLRDVAGRYRITAWHDAPAGTPDAPT